MPDTLSVDMPQDAPESDDDWDLIDLPTGMQVSLLNPDLSIVSTMLECPLPDSGGLSHEQEEYPNLVTNRNVQAASQSLTVSSGRPSSRFQSIIRPMYQLQRTSQPY